MLITEAEIKSIIHSLTPPPHHKKGSSDYEKISKILQACASLIGHP
jgi:hypothetical protein